MGKMEFKFLDDIIKAKLRLQFSDLEVLATSSASYEILLYQHGGKILIKKDFIGNDKSNNAVSKFREFIKLAKSENVPLAVTPEYSCPWELIEEIMGNITLQPAEGKLWAIGCEAISKKDIEVFKSKLKPLKNVAIYFDESILSSNKVFLNPLCYIFKAKANNGKFVTLLVIQFKTQYSGVWSDPTEKDNLIIGKEVYVLRNNSNTIKLFALICSDVEKFNITPEFKTSLSWDRDPFLILNIQLNPKPRDPLFLGFRNKILDYSYPYKEIISLNWAGETFSNEYPCTSIHAESNQFNMDESFLETNHHNGLYYTYRRQDNHCIFFNSGAYIFKIRNSQLLQAGTYHSMVRNAGPETLYAYKWGSSKFKKETVPLNDGFSDCLTSVKCALSSLKDSKISIFDKERLLNISNGTINKGSEWYKIANLKTFQISPSEHISRLTFAQDHETRSSRFLYIENMRVLNDVILADKKYFPKRLIRFYGNCGRVMFFKGTKGYVYAYNLVTKDEKYKATVAFIGPNDKSSAKKAFGELKNIFPDSQDWRNIVVWYSCSGNIISESELGMPTINDQSNVAFNSIAKEK